MELSSIIRAGERADQGAWVGDIAGIPDVSLKVRGIENVDFRRLQAKLYNAVPRAEKRVGISPQTHDRILGECLLKTILLDWKGITRDGEPVPFSEAEASALLLNPHAGRFRDAVVTAAGAVGDDAAEAMEDLTGNSAAA